MSTLLHENIRRLRKAAGLTLQQVGERSDMHFVTWSDIERGKNPNPTAVTLNKIAEALDVTVADLWVDEDGESVTL